MHATAPRTLKVLCVQMCVLCCTVFLAAWPLCSEAARLRCGTDLLSDLMFVCGDRGIYLGRGSWSGYGARPRGKGIVDQCCRPGGCDLQHLEKYCAKPKNHRQQQATALPTTAPTDTAEQFQAVFQRRLLEQVGAPDSPQREAYRNKIPVSRPRTSKASAARRRTSRQRADTTSPADATLPPASVPPADSSPPADATAPAA